LVFLRKREMNMDYFQLIDAMPASVYWKDRDGKYLGCNDYMCKMTGYTLKEVIGKTDYLMVWKEQANKLREIDQRVMLTARSSTIIEEFITIDGILHIFLSSKRPMFDENKKVVGIIGVSIDITEQKKTEELLVDSNKSLRDSLQAKEKFLRNLDHESRNSIQLAHVASNLLMTNWSSLGNNERFELVKEIDHSTTRFCTMINNIFDLSEFVTKEAVLKLGKYSLTKVVKEYVTIFSKQFNCKVEFIPTDNDFLVSFDKERISSVLMNLLLNAKKWSPMERTISVNLMETLISNYVPAVQCCIKDAGTGIEEDELESVFLPFIQGSKVKNSTGGVGAGLALCNEIIKAHAGEIWAENNLNKGCTFNFTIPMNLPIL